MSEGNQHMKKFLIYLADNRTVTITADHYTVDYQSQIVTFYKSEEEEDPDIHIKPGAAIAIYPLPEDKPEPQGSTSMRTY
jgi:hypothetical protein